MKVAIDNLMVVQGIKGDVDLREVNKVLKGSRYQPEVFKGVIYDLDDPACQVFILGDKTMKFHGLRSLETADRAVTTMMERLKSAGLGFGRASRFSVTDVIASHELGARLDPGKVVKTFEPDGILYDPNRLPGFILRTGTPGFEVLIFPEGKIVVRGARSIEDAASMLEMVSNRLSSAMLQTGQKAPGKA